MNSLNGTEILHLLILDSFGSDFMGEQYYNYFKYFPIFILFFLVSFLLTPIVGKFATKYGILNATKEVDTNRLNKHENRERRINPNRVPLLGGLSVVLPLYLAIPLFFGINQLTLPMLIALTIIIIYGVIDDAYNIPGTAQFIIQFVTASIVAFFIADLQVIKIPFDGVLDVNWNSWSNQIGDYSLLFTFPGDLIIIFWIMVCMNAVKWSNGLDALMESNMIVAFLMLFIIGTRTELLPVLVISAILCSGITAFTYYNLPPAKIFSSATGSLAYGFMIATLSIPNQSKFATTIIILLLPLTDFVFVLIKRLFIYRPRTVTQFFLTPIRLMRMADTNHLHHQLLKLKLTNYQIVGIETVFTLTVGSLAVLSAEAYRFFIILSSGGLLLGALLLLHILTHKRRIEEVKAAKGNETPESKYSY